MSQLLRIDNEKGIIYKYTEDFQSRLVATFGAGYLEPGTVIADLLWDEHPDILYGFVEASGQITMEELERNKVKEKEHGEVQILRSRNYLGKNNGREDDALRPWDC